MLPAALPDSPRLSRWPDFPEPVPLSSASSTVHLTALHGLVATHRFAPSAHAPGALFEAQVTITNITGATVSNLRYVQTIDWDVPPTEFNERVDLP